MTEYSHRGAVNPSGGRSRRPGEPAVSVLTSSPPGGLATFEAWDDPEIDACAVPVDGGYSRTAWLPVLGTTTWLVWGSLAARVADDRCHRCTLGELAPAHAPGPVAVVRALGRLEAYGLAEERQPGVWVVRPSCPPLWDRLLARAPSPVHAAHHVTFLPSRRRSAPASPG